MSITPLQFNIPLRTAMQFKLKLIGQALLLICSCMKRLQGGLKHGSLQHAIYDSLTKVCSLVCPTSVEISKLFFAVLEFFDQNLLVCLCNIGVIMDYVLPSLASFDCAVFELRRNNCNLSHPSCCCYALLEVQSLYW